MRIHRFHGGLKLDSRRETALASPIRGCALPPQLIIPLIARSGIMRPIVTIGDHVLRGQCIGVAMDGVGASAHASASGTISAIEQRDIASAHTDAATCVVIDRDEEDCWSRLSPVEDWRSATRDALLARIHEAGITGLGGAAFPTDIKLAAPVHTLIINGAECEPGISCDHALLIERADEVVQGAALLAHSLGAQQTFIAIEDRMQRARAALEAALSQYMFAGAVLAQVPTRYPQGGERQLIEALTGSEVPVHGLPRDIGVICHNVGTAAAAWRAVRHGEALTSRIVSVNGAGVAHQGNYEVRFGTPIAWLVEQAGGYTPIASRLLAGGTMMGLALAHDDVPIDASCNAIQVLTEAETRPTAPEVPCIRCGECARVCPAQLLPQQLFAYLTREDWPQVRGHALDACIECGCCAQVCPSQIPLVAWYRWGKSVLRDEVRDRASADAARARFEARDARLHRERDERDARRNTASVERTHGQDDKVASDFAANEDTNVAAPSISKSDVLAAIARSRAKREARLRGERDNDDGDAS